MRLALTHGTTTSTNSPAKKAEMATENRKLFHFIAVAILMPAILVDFADIALISFAVFWLLLWTSVYASYQIYPYGGYLRRVSTSITDHRDGGKLVLTPIYLIVGLSLPVWLDQVRFGRPQLSSFAGLCSVGLGDSAASIVGKRFGRNAIFRD